MILELSWDGMGFTSNEKYLEQALDAEASTALTERLIAAKELPPNILGVASASTDRDGKEGGEWKLFVNVALIVKVDSEEAAYAMQPPSALLRTIVNTMMGGEVFDELDLEGSFEILELNPMTEQIAIQHESEAAK